MALLAVALVAFAVMVLGLNEGGQEPSPQTLADKSSFGALPSEAAPKGGPQGQTMDLKGAGVVTDDPEEVFTAKTPPRNLMFTSPEGVAETTFRALDVEDLKNQPKPQEASPTANRIIGERQYLAQHGYSWSPEGLMAAARKGDAGAVQAYLNAGMDAATRNAFSSTALHAAAESNQLEVAQMLLLAGADVNAATTNLQTPLHRAVAQNLPAMSKLLLEHGANVGSATLEGWTPLFYAVNNNNKTLAEMLIGAGAAPNGADRFGNTALMLATRKNYTELAKRLLNLGARINETDLTGRTALHYAVSGGYYQLAKMLLENGARADVRDVKGLLPMDIALANQDLALANLLLANGSKRSQVLGTKARGVDVPTGQHKKVEPKPSTQQRRPQNYNVQ